MVNVKLLVNIAIAGGPIAIGGGAYFTYKMQSHFRKQEFYIKSLEILNGYEPAAEKIGKPMRAKKLDLGDKSLNYTDGLNARLAIPIVGSKTKATLHTWSSRACPGDSWDVDKADLEFKNRTQWTFYLNPKVKDKYKLSQDMTPEERAKWDEDMIDMLKKRHDAKAFQEKFQNEAVSDLPDSNPEMSYINMKPK